MTEIHFTVPGLSFRRARARTVRTKDGRTFSYTPDGTVLYENLIKTCYYQTGVNPFGADEELRPTKKPDLDNVIKSILDALNKVAYHDDTQIVSLSMEKFYSDSPRVEVTINSI